MNDERASQENPPGQDPNTHTIDPDSDKGSSSDSESLEELIETVDRQDLRRRQRSRSTTDTRRMKRCPECGSVKVKRKLDKTIAQGKQRSGDYRCDGCHHHFNHPDTPKNPPGDEQERDRRVQLRRDSIKAVRGDAGVGDQREAASDGGCRHSEDALPCWDCLGDS